jgi:large subunit ribosomal protein L17
MVSHRKLGKPTDQRMALLRNQVTALFENGRIKTTVTRAKEVRSIAEKLLTLAVQECDNYTTKQVKVTKAKLDSSGKKVLKEVESKHGNKYMVVDREETTELRTVDSPSRLHARRQILRWINDVKDENGARKKIVNKIFDEIAPRYKNVNGGYTRIYQLGPRRGDAAEMAILELVSVETEKAAK